MVVVRHEGSQVNREWGHTQSVGIQAAEFGSYCVGHVESLKPWSLSSWSSGQRCFF